MFLNFYHTNKKSTKNLVLILAGRKCSVFKLHLLHKEGVSNTDLIYIQVPLVVAQSTTHLTLKRKVGRSVFLNVAGANARIVAVAKVGKSMRMIIKE